MSIYLLPRDFDFSFPDFESLWARLTSAIPTVLSMWTNFARATMENIILDTQCFNFDVIMGYQSQMIRETRIATARARPAMRRMARTQHDYIPAETTAAQATVTLSIPAITPGDVPFPAGTPLFTAGPDRVSGQLLEAKTIAAGQTSVEGTWEHSETIHDEFTSTGKPRQKFPFSQAPYIWNTATFADASGAWEDDDGEPAEVDFLADYGAADKVFVVAMDENGFARIETGNSTYGAVPSGDVDVYFRIGGGDEGNVAAGSLTKVAGSFTDSLGNPVTVSCTNAKAATGGLPKESVAMIRFKAPAAGKAQERSVGRPDQEANAERVPAVANALVLTSNERAGIEENTGHVYAVGFGTKTASGRYRPVAITSDDKTAIETMLETTYSVPNTFDIIVLDTVFNEVSFEVLISVAAGYTFASSEGNVGVAESIYNALDDLFAVRLSDADGRAPNPDMGFGEHLGGKLQWHELFTLVSGTGGVDDIDEDMFVPPNDPILQTYEWPKLGSVRVTDADTGSYLEF